MPARGTVRSAGLTVAETGKVPGLSARTVVREWDFAWAWLFKKLEG